MEQNFEDRARGCMEELKGLYAQLFLFVNQTIVEKPTPEGAFPQTESLQEPTDNLMRAIEKHSKQFNGLLNASSDWKEKCDPELRDQIEDFSSKLRSGLTATLDRIEGRIDEVTLKRDEVKDALESRLKTKTGHRAYRKPDENPASSVFDSSA